MTDILIVWEKDRKKRMVPKTKWSCDYCGTRYDTEEEAEACERRGGEPLFKKGEHVRLLYSFDRCPFFNDTLVVLSARAVKPPEWCMGRCDAHWFEYTVATMDPDGKPELDLVVAERELRKAHD